MALYPAPDMRTGAISLWVAGDGEAERAAEVVRELGHVVSVVAAGARARGRWPTALRPRGPAARHPAAAAGQVDLPPRALIWPRWRRARRAIEGYLDAADTALDARRGGGARERGSSRRARTPRVADRADRRRGRAPRGARSRRSTSATRAPCCGSCPGWLAGQADGEWTLDGDESIRRRPVDRVAEPLRLMGAEIDCRDGRLPPLRVRGAPLSGIEYRMPVASAQVKSCLLLAGLLADGDDPGDRAAPDARPHRAHAAAPPARGSRPRLRDAGDGPRRAARDRGSPWSPPSASSRARSRSRATSPRPPSSSSPR